MEFAATPCGRSGCAFYLNAAPLVNACRKPGEWQNCDIIIPAAKLASDGTNVVARSFTVLHNVVLIQNNVPIKGKATIAAKFSGATPRRPLVLQDHGNPVRFRSIWIRPS